MEYDFDKNVWRAAGSLPNTLARILCCVASNDNIFVFGFAENDGQIGYAQNDGHICYMFEPPPIRRAAGAQAKAIGMWTTIERPKSSHVNYV